MKTVSILFAVLLYASAANAYPERPVRVIVPFPAGSADAAARIVFEKVSERLKQPFVVEDKPGAEGVLGVQTLLRAPADGYTLLLSPDGPMATVPAAYRSAGVTEPYDPTTLTPVSQIAESYFVLVVGKMMPVSDAKSLIAYGKAHPAALTFFSANPSETLGIALLNERGAHVIEDRDFPSGDPVGHRGILGGTDQGMFSTTSTALPFLKEGSEKALGSMGPERSPFLPSLETLDEQGYPEFRQLTTWNAVFAPPGTQASIVQILNRAIASSLQDSGVLKKFQAMGISARPSSPEALGLLVKAQLRTLTQVIRETGVQLK